MLTKLTPQPADKILALVQQYREDPRDTKIDLGVGVYKDATGLTPVMRAVKAAEHLVWQSQTSKSYVGLAGAPEFSDAMIDLVLGTTAPRDRLAAAATPGGTGAIRQGLELIQMAAPEATIWISAPTWPNHPSIIRYLGMNMAEYRYFNSETRGVDFEGMMSDLADAKSGDIVLLHGCCHNPTGANLNAVEWDAVIALILEKGLIPFIDIAYQGFGDGLAQDSAPTRKIINAVPEALIAASCSKNFGIYRERTGILMALSPASKDTKLTQGTLSFLNRQNFSFPPDHGARLVSTILTDPDLRRDWEAELNDIRANMLSLRTALADTLRSATGSDRFGFLADHRGMFSRLGTTPEMVEKLRVDHGIYMISDSRMNIAGLNAKTVPILAAAIAEAGI